jgi:hypothetical protein
MTLTSEQLCFSLELAVLIQRASGQTTPAMLTIPAETGALIVPPEHGEVQAINLFEPYMTKLTLSGKYRVLLESSRNSSDRRLSKPAWRY